MPMENLIPLLKAARSQARLLPADHPSVTNAVRDLLAKIDEGLRQAPSVMLSILGGEIYLDGRLLAHESIAYADVVRELTDGKLDNLVFSRGLTRDELLRFIVLTNLHADVTSGRGGWKSVLEEEAIRHISTDLVVGFEQFTAEPSEGERAAKEMHKLCLDAVITSFNEVREGHLFDFRAIQAHVRKFTAALMDDQQIFHNLITIKDKDQYTFHHSVNVAVLSLLMGFRLKMAPELLEVVGTAAMLHDIGKMHIPPEILNKPEGLSEDELAIMQSHSIEGAKILLQMPDLQALPMVVAAQHHAKHSLGGYPDFSGLGRLHMLTEIVIIADVFDALTSDRSYRSAMMPDQAIKIIADDSGSHFHPALVKVFAQLSGMFPIGTLVELDTGELAVVVRPNPADLYRPGVRIASHRPGIPPDPNEVQLSERDNGGGYKRSIVRSVDPRERGLKIPPLAMGGMSGSPPKQTG